jgi:myo-inositol-1(or 4)-monophosphatase
MDARRLADAFEFAFNAHDGVTRKQSFMPYITHPMEAAFIVSSVPGISEEAVIAAILHDVVEDTEYTADDIEKHFGKKIRDLVASESEDKMVHLPKEESWKLRKEAFLNHLKESSYEAKVICLADKLSNLKQTVVDLTLRGPDIWNKFNMKDVSLQKWYYESVLDSLKELDSLPAYKELEECVNFVFKDHLNK